MVTLCEYVVGLVEQAWTRNLEIIIISLQRCYHKKHNNHGHVDVKVSIEQNRWITSPILPWTVGWPIRTHLCSFIKAGICLWHQNNPMAWHHSALYHHNCYIALHGYHICRTTLIALWNLPCITISRLYYFCYNAVFISLQLTHMFIINIKPAGSRLTTSEKRTMQHGSSTSA